MRFGFRAITGTALALAMFAGDVATLSLTPAAASAQFYGGGYGGYGGGYGGYRGHSSFSLGLGFGGYGGYGGGYGGYYGGGGFGLGEALLGAAIIGGTAAIISSNNRRRYDESATVYQAYPPAYAPSYAPRYAPGYAPPVDYGAAPAEPAYVSHDPVEQCSRVAVSEAANHGDSGRVVSIDRVDGRENGARVLGTMEINRSGRDGNRSGFERARFTCTADYGQVTAFRFG